MRATSQSCIPTSSHIPYIYRQLVILNCTYMIYSTQIHLKGKTIQIVVGASDRPNVSMTQVRLNACFTMIPFVLQLVTLILSPKPVISATSGFKVQTIKLSMLGFMDQTSKPSYMPNKV